MIFAVRFLFFLFSFFLNFFKYRKTFEENMKNVKKFEERGNVQQFLPAKQKKILLHLFYAIGKKKIYDWG